MRRRLLQHFRSQFVGYIALVIAIGGGTAYAANTIFSGDIVNGEVKTPDLANSAVTTGKVLDESLTGHDIQDDTIGGADVNESLLRLTAAGVVDESLTGHDIQDDTIGGADVNESLLTGVSMASFSSHDPPDFPLPASFLSNPTQVISLLDSSGPSGKSGGWLDLPFQARVIVNGTLVFRTPSQYDSQVWCRTNIAVAGGDWVGIAQPVRGTIPSAAGDPQRLTLPITGEFDTTSPGSYNVQVECAEFGWGSESGYEVRFVSGDLTAVAIAR